MLVAFGLPRTLCTFLVCWQIFGLQTPAVKKSTTDTPGAKKKSDLSIQHHPSDRQTLGSIALFFLLLRLRRLFLEEVKVTSSSNNPNLIFDQERFGVQ
jgi:hypothetical protein